MQTADQIEANFLAELQALLDKYGAELEVIDSWQESQECGDDARMEVTIFVTGTDANSLPLRVCIDLGCRVRPTRQESA